MFIVDPCFFGTQNHRTAVRNTLFLRTWDREYIGYYFSREWFWRTFTSSEAYVLYRQFYEVKN
jgi:hypothetical protein